MLSSWIALSAVIAFPAAMAQENFVWYSDYACQGASIGSCSGEDVGTCCTPPGYARSFYATANDGGAYFSFTVNSEANCNSPVEPYVWSQNSDGSGCYGASDASVGSVTIGETE